MMLPETPRPWLAHLKELRTCLLWIAVTFCAGCALCYGKSEILLEWLSAPLYNDGQLISPRLIFLGLTEAFTTYIKIALWGGFIVTIPMIAYQVWRFVAPGLLDHEKRTLRPFWLLSPILFLSGALFAYYCVLPLAWSFFLSFQNTALSLPLVFEARLTDYISLELSFLLAFGLSFEFPLVLVALSRLGILSAESLAQNRKYALVLILVVAAILTPPDILSQIMLAIPLMCLYEGAMWYIRRVERAQNLSSSSSQRKSKHSNV